MRTGLLLAALWGRMGGACVARWRGETRRGRPAAERGRRSMGIAVGRPKGAARIGPVRHRFASQARAWAERPPLWGNDDVSAMRNYRYRHRDSPYVARRSGNEHPEPDDRGRSAANFPERGGAEGLGVRDVAAVQGAVAARARRGERHRPCGAARRAVRRGAKRIAPPWATIRAAGQPFAPPWASALSERPFRPRRKPRAPVRTWPRRPG